jgi:1-acyl-sn-glycerol-3-phosphate acyltransferase
MDSMDDYRNIKLKRFFDGTATKYMRNRILMSDIKFDKNGYDEFGTSLDVASKAGALALFMYMNYFRVDAHSVENIPAEGVGLIVSNHAPILPFDAAMIWTAGLVELKKPRFIRTIIHRALSGISGASILLMRCGQIAGCDENVRKIFENENLIVVFPTGAESDFHTIFNKYKVDAFPPGFMEYAIEHRAPIIPTCVTGSEESAMTLGKIDMNVLGFKHLPITPIFPFLGLLGLLPFPSKFDLHFDTPVNYHENYPDAPPGPESVRVLVDGLHDHIQKMLNDRLGLHHK